MRYVKQRNNTSCGPIAVLNALKWAGFKFTMKNSYKRLAKKCKYNVSEGAWPIDVLNAISSYKRLTVTPDAPTKIQDLDDRIRAGSSCILTYYWYDEGAQEVLSHYTFISEMQGTSFVCHNIDDVSTAIVPRKDMITLLRSARGEKPLAFFIDA
jgi:hypothetical protein